MSHTNLARQSIGVGLVGLVLLTPDVWNLNGRRGSVDLKTETGEGQDSGGESQEPNTVSEYIVSSIN